MLRTLAALLLARGATSLQLAPRTAAPRPVALRVAAPLAMAEPGGGKPSEPLTLTDEQIMAAAKAASAQGADPFAGVTSAPKEAEPFDPRIILYVSLPALVLVGQLFFTFSRDVLAGDSVGPAVMDLWIP